MKLEEWLQDNDETMKNIWTSLFVLGIILIGIGIIIK